jgi:allantoin racemase
MRIMVLNQSPRDPTDDEYDTRVKALLESYASPGSQVDLCYPDDYPGAQAGVRMNEQGVRNELGYLISTPALVRKIVWAERHGYDAAIQSNAFDPGVEAARLAVRIPVIGLCRTTLHAAANLADRIAVTVPFDTYVGLTRRLINSYGLLGHVVDIRSLSLGAVPRGDQVAVARPKIFQRALEVMTAIVRETGAECIVPLGGAIIPYIVSPVDLQQEVGVPVLNTKAIGIHFAEMCVHLGMSQSAQTYPPAKLEDRDFALPAYAVARA